MSSPLIPQPLSAYLRKRPPQFSVRVGPQYQIGYLPEVRDTSKNENNGEVIFDLTDEPEDDYEAHLTYSAKMSDQNQIGKYLYEVEKLFYFEPSHFDPEKALQFLHRCNYNYSTALELLRPIEVPTIPTSPAHSTDSEMDASLVANSDDLCCICFDGGQLLICEFKGCGRVYHAQCVGLEVVPKGKWECPRHTCQVCHSPLNHKDFHCSRCLISYCQSHAPKSDQRNLLKSPAKQSRLCQHCTRKKTQKELQKMVFLQKLADALQHGNEDIQNYQTDIMQLWNLIERWGGIDYTLTHEAAWTDVDRQFFLNANG